MYLSDHFTLTEAMQSQTASRLGIDNTPPDILTPDLTLVATRVLEPVRVEFGIPYSPTSWFRGEELEKAICWAGRENSSFGRWCVRRSLPINDESWSRYFVKKQHPKGNAADIKLPGVSNLDLGRFVQNNIVFDQLILEHYSPTNPLVGWVHVSVVEEGNRGDVLMFNGKQFVEAVL